MPRVPRSSLRHDAQTGVASRHRAGLLHTVLFHRTLGVVKPKDTQLSLFDVVYVRWAPGKYCASG